ncbi:MAG: putative O-glycosylation ligase, exosortase A system-associated [Burkholderiales bacterium]|nr:putative O-glycosylation ligase, exosortase A system-associated [Burkholderiales bacterium]
MRDIALALVVFGLLPFVFKRPFWGILMLAWLGYMNPHRLAWGFMFDMPVVMIVAVVTLVAMLASKEAKRVVWGREIVVLVIFILWMTLTTTQARLPGPAWLQFDKVIKIQILTFMTLVMLTSRERVHMLIWVIVLSLGFYGVKGGIFTIANGGSYRVQGPEGSFIGGNNEMALALVMTIPLMRYLQLHERDRRIQIGLGIGMLLTALAAVGSHSRGALLALVITGLIFWFKSRRKLVTALLVAIPAIATLYIMPSEWFDRIQSIGNYEQDASAQGRFMAWRYALGVANSRVLGVGFEGFKGYDAHSIYFEVLGEHGWVGLAIFLTLLGFTWLKCGSIIRIARRQPQTMWARDLAAMIQVSLVGYMSAGAFLGLAYFDFFYHLMATVVVVHHLLTRSAAAAPAVMTPVEPLSLFGALRRA